jgi:hypothetical protein
MGIEQKYEYCKDDILFLLYGIILDCLGINKTIEERILNDIWVT